MLLAVTTGSSPSPRLAPGPNRRAPFRLFVRRFQFRFVAANLAFFTAIGLGFVVLLFGPLVVGLLDPSATLAREAEAQAFLVLHNRIWVLVALVAVVGTLGLAVQSHRVAGPLVQFMRVFNALKVGDVSGRIRIREHDYLHEEASALDAAVRGMRRRILAAQVSASRLEAAMASLRAAEPGSQGAVAAHAHVEASLKRLRRHLSLVRTTVPASQVVGRSEGAGARVRAREESGFTLVELLAVVAIIGITAAIGAPMYGRALDAARIAKAIADIKGMSNSIVMHQLRTGSLPDNLSQVGLDQMMDPYGRPYVYLRIDNLKGKGSVRKDRQLNPINSDFDLYSIGKDGQTKLQVSNKDSLDDIIRAHDGGFIGLALNF